jgi:hypothetical protein
MPKTRLPKLNCSGCIHITRPKNIVRAENEPKMGVMLGGRI